MKERIGLILQEYPLVKYWILASKEWRKIKIVDEKVLWWPDEDVSKVKKRLVEEYDLVSEPSVVDLGGVEEKVDMMKFMLNSRQMNSKNRIGFFSSFVEGVVGRHLYAGFEAVDAKLVEVVDLNLGNMLDWVDLFSRFTSRPGDELGNWFLMPFSVDSDMGKQEIGAAAIDALIYANQESIAAVFKQVKTEGSLDIGLIGGVLSNTKRYSAVTSWNLINSLYPWIQETRKKRPISISVMHDYQGMLDWVLNKAEITDVELEAWKQGCSYFGANIHGRRLKHGYPLGYVEITDVKQKERIPLHYGEVLMLPLKTEVFCQTVFEKKVFTDLDRGALLSGVVMIDLRGVDQAVGKPDFSQFISDKEEWTVPARMA